MVQKRNMRRPEQGGIAQHIPRNRKGKKVALEESPRKVGGQSVLQVANSSLTRQFVTQDAVQLLLSASATHASTVQCSAKHGFEENAIKMFSRHCLPGEAAAGRFGVKESAVAGMSGDGEGGQGDERGLVKCGRSLSVTGGAHRSPQSNSHPHYSHDYSYSLVTTELPQPFKAGADIVHSKGGDWASFIRLPGISINLRAN